MTIGERIRKARREAGLSQRQLAGEAITRNMLSLLEHDQANPSLETLRYLSRQLEKPVSYFLGEDAAMPAGLRALDQAREALAAGEFSGAMDLADQIPGGDVLETERELIWATAVLAEAEQSIGGGRSRYAQQLLTDAAARMTRLPYAARELEARRTVLLARSAGSAEERAAAAAMLPDVDEILLLRAQAALEAGQTEDAARNLEAVQRRDDRWQLLQGEVWFARERWAEAAECYALAERSYALRVRRRLQLCYAKLGDFEKAYAYATME